jgi:uncharacterized membrane protein YeaQ/YmgE (transglycosylase-associated protein family)
MNELSLPLALLEDCPLLGAVDKRYAGQAPNLREGWGMLWTIITWIILGGLAGWIASMITGMNDRMGGWMNIIVGVIGAFIGGLVLQLLGANSPSGFNLGSLLTAILGAIILLALVRAFRRDPL